MSTTIGSRRSLPAGFVRLWVSETVSLAGSQITVFAIPLVAVLTLAVTPFEAALVATAGTAPNIALGLVAGVWADRAPPYALLRLANLGRAFAVVTIPLCWVAGALNLWVLCLANFVVGALTLVFDSTMTALVPRLVRAADIPRANSWLQGSSAAAETAGPGAAGVLVQALGPPVALVVDTVSYCVASVILRTERRVTASPARGSVTGTFTMIRGGISILLRDPRQRGVVVAATHFNFFTSWFFALLVVFAVNELGWSATMVGIFGAVGGAAGVVAALLSASITARIGAGRSLVVGFALSGPCALAVPASAALDRIPGFMLVCVAQAVWVFCVVSSVVVCTTIRQVLVPDDVIGRVASSARFFTWGVEPVGAMAGGAVAALAGPATALTVAAVGLGSAALWATARPVRTLTLDRVGCDSAATKSIEGA